MRQLILSVLIAAASGSPTHAAPPDVSHLSTRDRELVLTCERVNGYIERELKSKGASNDLSLEGMCMFGHLQSISWYTCMERQFKSNLTQKQAAMACVMLRRDVEAPQNLHSQMR